MKKITDIKIKSKDVNLILENKTEFDENLLKYGLSNTCVPPKSVPPKSEPAKFVSEIFKSRDIAHIYHWKAKEEGSFAAHKALEEYYTEILELVDTFVEVFGGQYSVIENYAIIDSSNTSTQDRIEYFIGLAEFIKNNRYKAFLKEDSHLQNIIDEMVSLIYQTLYRLRLK